LVGKSRQISNLDSDDQDNDIKWQKLIHNGLYFPEEYIPLPKNVKLLYNGKEINLDSTNTNNKFQVTAEECAVFFATKMEQDDRIAEKQKSRHKAKDDHVFVENFFDDWKVVLGEKSVVKDWKKIDFSNIQRYITEKSEEKKARSKDEKEKEKIEKAKLKEKYGYATVDGYRSAIGAWTVQPPGLFIGHGKQPKRGGIKGRLRPKDITINCSKGDEPKCEVKGRPCKWGAVIEDKTVTWIASYRNPVTDLISYVYLDRKESKWVCASDQVKFDKAKKLKENIETIRKVYNKDLDSKDSKTKQCATCVYLLDKLAIRPGAEKDEKEEADTVGLTTLKCNNIEFIDNNKIELKFVGKSSIEFQKQFKIESKVYSILKNLCKTSKENPIFKDIKPEILNKYLSDIIPELTAKVFRTWKACSTLQDTLDDIEIDMEDSITDKKVEFDKANMKVAEALNHKTLSQNDNKTDKIQKKLEEAETKLEKQKTDKQKERIENQIKKYKTDLEGAKGNISLSTSKVNYIDPRIVIAWCKRVEMPIEKIYTKTSLTKFTWAMQIESEWKF